MEKRKMQIAECKSSPHFSIGKLRSAFCNVSKIDGLVKSLKMGYSVILVKTGIQSFQYLGKFWIPACAGMTIFYEVIKIDGSVKSRNSIEFVIPAKAGIQLFQGVLDPGFRRGDGLFDFLRSHQN